MPQEKKTFVFTFRSEKEGIFYEEWQLHTIPELPIKLPAIQLNGVALKYDCDELKYRAFKNCRRKLISDRIEDHAKHTLAKEIIDDLVEAVRTPTPPPPNIRDPVVFCYLFENNNRKLRLHFSQSIIDKYLDILKRVGAELKEEIPDPAVDCSIACLSGYIQKVKDQRARIHFSNELKYLLESAANKAFDRSYAYPQLKNITESIVQLIPEISDRLCEEQGIPAFTFEEPADRTPEELAKLDEDRKAAAADFYKKAKKKPKSEDEVKETWEEVKVGITKEAQEEWAKRLDGLERELEKKQVENSLLNYERMDYSKYETLSRKKSILDETVQENIVLLRLDLEAELSPIEYDEIEVTAEPGSSVKGMS